MNIHSYIEKLRTLPDKQKKIVLWTVVIVLALVMGFFWIKSAMNNLQKLGENVSQIKFPEIQIPKGEISDWKTYTNDKYGFELKYPDNWTIDQFHTTDLETSFSKSISNEEAVINIEIVSKTQSINSVQGGIDNTILRMKNIVKQKEEIKIGDYSGYEVIGSLCTSICTGSTGDIYSLFSIIYFPFNNEIFEIQYIEGIKNEGFKKDIKDWKYYDEFLKIISTFKFTK